MRISHVFVAAQILMVGLVSGCSILLNQPMNASEQAIEAELSGWSPSEQQILSCLKLALNKGLFDLAETLVALAPNTKHSVFHAIYNDQVKRLTQFSRSLVVGWTRISPVVKWAQSNDTVLVTFKLSHRWDSPPCTSTKAETSTFQNNTLEYVNECIVSRQRIYFGLSLRFWAEVESDALDIRRDGVGTYTFKLRKKEAEVWPYLDHSRHRYQVWGEIAERYPASMEAYARMVEEQAKDADKSE